MKRLIFKVCLLGPGKDVFRCFPGKAAFEKYCQENCDPNEGLVDFNDEPLKPIYSLAFVLNGWHTIKALSISLQSEDSTFQCC